MAVDRYRVILLCLSRNAGSSSREAKDSPKKLKALQDTILKMNEKNYKLQAENKTLKQDLDKMMQTAEKSKSDHGTAVAFVTSKYLLADMHVYDAPVRFV